ncbi:hypothetical protein [Mycobacterium sp. DL440]|uniref:hypothetical protein n=1 Tax=Mycobacterium sp. DL440 TaxID=2675523 RepID=UPI0014236470|nr:hypothetical protein [Mycobacterium sp. DL440]
MTPSSSQKIQAAMGAVMLAVGATAVLAPARFGSSAMPGQDYQTRMWALRETALGAILFGTRNSQRRRPVLAATTALAVAELAVSLREPTLAKANRWSAVASSAVFGVAGALAARNT